MEVAYAPQFRRQFRKLDPKLQEEALEKISLFADRRNHERLKVHRLNGVLEGRYSFSVNYRFRILFMWEEKYKAAILLAIGDHAVYE